MKKPPSNFNSDLDRGIVGIQVQIMDPPEDPYKEASRVARFFDSTWGAIYDWSPGSYLLKAQAVAAGEGLPNALECVNLTFSFEGITRATTHQLVRSRVGVGFGQQGGRDNNWHNFNFRIPATIGSQMERNRIEQITQLSNQLYEDLIESGVPYQDARYILPMGLETGLVGTYNLLALKGTLKRRLCNRMAWEINYVARKMHDLTVVNLPWVGKSLRSGCEDRGVCGSVSPMFPPACYKSGQLTLDNKILSAEIMSSGGDYEWPETSNGCYIHFDQLDKHRTEKEPVNEVWSLVSGEPLIVRNTTGEWVNV